MADSHPLQPSHVRAKELKPGFQVFERKSLMMVFLVAFSSIQGCSRYIDGIRTATEISKRNKHVMTSNNPDAYSSSYDTESKSENDNRRMVTCIVCYGMGRLLNTDCTFGWRTEWVSQPWNGTGDIPDLVEKKVPCEEYRRCETCGGTGQVTEQVDKILMDNRETSKKWFDEWQQKENDLKLDCLENGGEWNDDGLPPIFDKNQSTHGSCHYPNP